MATTIDDLVRESYRELNVIGERGSLTYEQLAQGLRHVNRLLDSWNINFGLPNTVSISSFNLVIGQNSYTIGSGGDVNTTRPLKIINATIQDGDLNYPMAPINYQEWMDIYDKSDTSDVPSKFYYDNNMPLGVIYVWPKPTKVVAFRYSQERKYGSYVAADEVTLHPGVERAIVCGVAKELLTKYPSEAIGQLVIQNAKDAVNDLRKYQIKQHLRDIGTIFDSQQSGNIDNVN